eukprot:18808-Heterococcus_DN1.PRE.2
MALPTYSDATTQFAKLVVDCCGIAGARSETVCSASTSQSLSRSGGPRHSRCKIDALSEVIQ